MELKRRAFERDLVAQYQAGYSKSFLLAPRECTLYTFCNRWRRKVGWQLADQGLPEKLPLKLCVYCVCVRVRDMFICSLISRKI